MKKATGSSETLVYIYHTTKLTYQGSKCKATALETKILQQWMYVFQNYAQIFDTAPLLFCIITSFRGKYSNSLQSTKYSLIKICSKQKLCILIQSILWHTSLIECWPFLTKTEHLWFDVNANKYSKGYTALIQNEIKFMPQFLPHTFKDFIRWTYLIMYILSLYYIICLASLL